MASYNRKSTTDELRARWCRWPATNAGIPLVRRIWDSHNHNTLQTFCMLGTDQCHALIKFGSHCLQEWVGSAHKGNGGQGDFSHIPNCQLWLRLNYPLQTATYLFRCLFCNESSTFLCMYFSFSAVRFLISSLSLSFFPLNFLLLRLLDRLLIPPVVLTNGNASMVEG